MQRLMATLVLAVGFLVVSQGSAVASEINCPPGQVPTNPGDGVICIPAQEPGPPNNNPNPGNPGTGGCTFAGQEISCTRDDGAVWFASRSCYANRLDYPYSHPSWEGRTEGSLYACDGVGPGGAPQSGEIFWVPPSETAPDPVVLARNALERMQLVTPNVQMAPMPPQMSYVGLETWLWIPDNQWRSITESATAGATTVTVVAEPSRITWDLTTGSTTCTSPGRAWVRGMSERARTDCSYTWDRVSSGESGGAFGVSATLTYQVDWTCSGNCLSSSGTLGEVDGVAGSSSIRVGERQSVIVSP